MATSATLELSVKSSGAVKSLKNVEKQLGKVDKQADKTKKKLNKGGGMFGGMKKGLSGMLPMINPVTVALGAIAGTVAGIKKAANSMDALAKSARAVGAAGSKESFKQYQVLGKMFEEAGMSTSDYARALNNIQVRMAQGEAGNKKYAAILEKLGDSARKSNGELKDAPGLMIAFQEGIAKGIFSLDESAETLGVVVGPKIHGAAVQIGEAGGTIKASLDELGEVHNIIPLEAAESAEAFNDTMGRLGAAFTKVLQPALNAIMPILADLAENILASINEEGGTLNEIMGGLKEVFNAIQPILKLAWEAFKFFFDVLATAMEITRPFWEFVAPAIKEACELIESVVTALPEAIEAAWELFKQGIKSVYDWVAGPDGWLQKMVDFFKDMPKALLDGIGTITETLKDTWDRFVQSIKNVWELVAGEEGWLAQIIKGFAEFPGKILQWLKDLVTKTKQKWDEFIQDIKDMWNWVKEQLDAIVTFFAELPGRVVSAVFGLADAIAEPFKSGMQKAWEWVQSIADRIIAKVRQAANAVSSLRMSDWRPSSLGGPFNFKLFAHGGRLGAGKTGIAGEAGPELVTGPAQITPLSGSGAMGNATFNFNVTGGGSSSGSSQQDLNRLAAGLMMEARKMLIKEQRFGGVLA